MEVPMSGIFGESSFKPSEDRILPELEVRPDLLTEPSKLGIEKRATFVSTVMARVLLRSGAEETISVPEFLGSKRTVTTSVNRASLESLAAEYGVQPQGLDAQRIVDQILSLANRLKPEEVISDGRVHCANRGQLASIINGLRSAGATVANPTAFGRWYIEQMQKKPPFDIEVTELLSLFTMETWPVLGEDAPPIVKKLLSIKQEPEIKALQSAVRGAGLSMPEADYYATETLTRSMLVENFANMVKLQNVLLTPELSSNSFVKSITDGMKQISDLVTARTSREELWEKIGIGKQITDEIKNRVLAFAIEKYPSAEETLKEIQEGISDRGMTFLRELHTFLLQNVSDPKAQEYARLARSLFMACVRSEPVTKALIAHGFIVPPFDVLLGEDTEHTMELWAQKIVAQNWSKISALLAEVSQHTDFSLGATRESMQLAKLISEQAVIVRDKKMESTLQGIARDAHIEEGFSAPESIKKLNEQGSAIQQAIHGALSKFDVHDIGAFLSYVLRQMPQESERRFLTSVLEDELLDALEAAHLSQEQYVEFLYGLGIDEIRAILKMQLRLPEPEELEQRESIDEMVDDYAEKIIEANRVMELSKEIEGLMGALDKKWPQKEHEKLQHAFSYLARSVAPCIDGTRSVSPFAQKLAQNICDRVEDEWETDISNKIEELTNLLSLKVKKGEDRQKIIGEINRVCKEGDGYWTADDCKEFVYDAFDDIDAESLALFLQDLSSAKENADVLLPMLLEVLSSKVEKLDHLSLYYPHIASLLSSPSLGEVAIEERGRILRNLTEKELLPVLKKFHIDRSEIADKALTPENVAFAISIQRGFSQEDAVSTLQELGVAGNCLVAKIIPLLMQVGGPDQLGEIRKVLLGLGYALPVKKPQMSVEDFASSIIQELVEADEYSTIARINLGLKYSKESQRLEGVSAELRNHLVLMAPQKLNETSEAFFKQFENLSSIQDPELRKTSQRSLENELHSLGVKFLYHFAEYVDIESGKPRWCDAIIESLTNIINGLSPGEVLEGNWEKFLEIISGPTAGKKRIIITLRNAVQRTFLRQFLMAHAAFKRAYTAPSLPEDTSFPSFASDLVILNPTKIEELSKYINAIARRSKGDFVSGLNKEFRLAATQWFEKNVEAKFISAISTIGKEKILVPTAHPRNPRQFAQDLVAANKDNLEAIIDSVKKSCTQSRKEVHEALSDIHQDFLIKSKKSAEEITEEIRQIWSQLRQGEEVKAEEGSLGFELTKLWKEKGEELEPLIEWEDAMLDELEAISRVKGEKSAEEQKKTFSSLVENLAQQGLVSGFLEPTGNLKEDLSALAQKLITQNEGTVGHLFEQLKPEALMNLQIEEDLGKALIEQLQTVNAERKKSLGSFVELCKSQGLMTPEIPQIADFEAYTISLVQANPGLSPKMIQEKMTGVEHQLKERVVKYIGQFEENSLLKSVLQEKGFKIPGLWELGSENGYMDLVVYHNTGNLDALKTFINSLPEDKYGKLKTRFQQRIEQYIAEHG